MSAIAPRPPAWSRRRAKSRLVAVLAFFMLSAVFFCVVIGSILVRQADDRQEKERRSVLIGAMADIRAAGGDVGALDPKTIRGMERIAGLKDLRFELDPEAGDREVQSVLDGQGRIVGWFSWEPERSMTATVNKLRPLLIVTGICLLGFAGVALWQMRRVMRDLARSEGMAWALAHEDMLTGLPNHRKMIELIDTALAARAREAVVTLAFIDLDGLNDVNDAHGHDTGDRLLVAVAERLGDLLPQQAAGGRFDGDEFAMVMTSQEIASAEVALGEIAAALARPFWINDQAVQVGATVGYAHAPRDAQNCDELMRRSDLALRVAKRVQRGGVQGFEPKMAVEFSDRRFIERELKRALAENALDVYYQPIVTSDGTRIAGVEALVRWRHPDRGFIPPMAFVPVAEQAGLMGQLGEFVLQRALLDAGRWPDIFIAVNLSPVQVRDQGLVGQVSTLLRETGVAPSRLVLEVTEGVLIDNPDEAKARLDGLRALGVRLALDDFGTGYSSLTYLQRFRFDKLKIDKAFVAPLGRSGESQAMIQAIVTLGRALGLTLLAEGVETEEQRVLLRLLGCEEMQGYLFAHPAPREALDGLMAETPGLLRAIAS